MEKRPETVREMLDRVESRLIGKLDVARKEISQFERELADVRRAKAALVHPDAPAMIVGGTASTNNAAESMAVAAVTSTKAESPYRNLTMKQLALKALNEQFTNGATSNQLLDFFHKAWNRTDVVRESLSPQLSRLKRDGAIDFKNGLWVLLAPAKEKAPDVGASSASKGGGGAPPLPGQNPRNGMFG